MDNAYNQIAEQAKVQRTMEDAALAERLRNAGMNTPLTIQNNNQMADMRNLGNIASANQNYANQQSAMSDQNAANMQALKADIAGQAQFNESNALMDEANRKREIYYSLFNKRRLSASQFKKLTGIDAKTYSAGRGKSTPSVNDWFTQSPTTYTPGQQSQMKYLENQVNQSKMTPDEAMTAFDKYYNR